MNHKAHKDRKAQEPFVRYYSSCHQIYGQDRTREANVEGFSTPLLPWDETSFVEEIYFSQVKDAVMFLRLISKMHRIVTLMVEISACHLF
ncbi:unnamed protein product [Arabidopsis thaliana]|uniref:(thale cress) hypothetical protein n=1 Tax=Arabidopsis thaliana TaxID=3702 RepID=A0A7G2E8F9_ARATH|nr:unnamed protein product [Arabidopsis thaliana]